MKDRLVQFLSYLGIGQLKFENEVGLSRGFVNKVGDNITTKSLGKIEKRYPNLNTEWLLTGLGPMLKPTDQVNEHPVKYELRPKDYSTHLEVKLVTTRARAGYSESYYSEEYLEDMPTLLIEADREYRGKYLAFEVDGDSMEPEYHPGDVVICRV